MNLFFDTNVILDYLIPTNSSHEEANINLIKLNLAHRFKHVLRIDLNL